MEADGRGARTEVNEQSSLFTSNECCDRSPLFYLPFYFAFPNPPTRTQMGVDWRDDGKASPLRYSFRAAGFWY
jgi:hypothetical protein